MKITVYTKPSCVQCNATKRALVKAGLAYEEVDLTASAAAPAVCVLRSGAPLSVYWCP